MQMLTMKFKSETNIVYLDSFYNLLMVYDDDLRGVAGSTNE